MLVVALALTCGVSAAVGVYQFRLPAEGVPADTVPVVTAVADLGRWHVLDPSVVKVSRYPKHEVPKGALSSTDEVTGRSLLYPLAKGEPLLDSKLTQKGAGRGLAAMVPDGMRAFTIQTPHVAAGVGGFIRPGDKVDVLLTTTTSSVDRDDATGGAVTTTLLQNVQVMAVAQRLDAAEERKIDKVDPNEVKCVTLLVTPDQAARLDLGMNKGILHLALRNPKDDRDARTQPATMAQLRFHQEKPFNFAGMWSQLTTVANRLASGMSQTETAPQKASPGLAPASQPSWALIRTLRGSQAGGVRVDFGQ